MLFRRRSKPKITERLRVMAWPRRSWSRSIRYFAFRLRRLSGSPHSVAAGFAAGVFAVITPFVGLQMLAAAAIAVLLRGSVVASAIGSFAGNPLTYPLIWFSTFKLGKLMLGEPASFSGADFQAKAGAIWDGVSRLSPDAIGAALEAFWPILKPMAIGAIPIGLAAAAISYFTVRRIIESARADKHERFKFNVI